LIGKTLVAYASRCGSTAEVAEAVGQVMRESGRPVDVVRVTDVRSLAPYRAVVLGTAIRMAKPLSDAIVFARRNRMALSQMPTALFSLGVKMREDTAENREAALGFLAPILSEVRQPARLGLFAGKFDCSQLSPLWRLMTSLDKSGQMVEGDWRSWDAIRGWAGELSAAFAGF
jgi:menaquinone-dependent protoporphyrinogen oxidase